MLAAAEGLELTDDPAEADVLLMNTCSIREKAQEKVFSQLGYWKALKNNGRGVIIGVGGCVASQEGEAIIKRLVEAGLVEARRVRVAEIVPSRREFLQAAYGVSAVAEPAAAAAGFETVVVAVKPQNLAEALSDLRGRLTADQLLLSIVAGATVTPSGG